MQQQLAVVEQTGKQDTLASRTSQSRSVSLDQAAHLLGVSRRTIYNHIRSGHLTTVRTYGSQRVLVESLDAFVNRLS